MGWVDIDGDTEVDQKETHLKNWDFKKLYTCDFENVLKYKLLNLISRSLENEFWKILKI